MAGKKRTIDDGLGHKIKVDCYEKRHYPENQKLFDGIPFDPVLPDGFDNTPNEYREPLEVEHWWDRPFIVPVYFNEMLADNSYQEYVARCSEFLSYASLGSVHLDTEERWLERRQDHMAKWYAAYPSGVRFDVRCLDGGAWDRSTGWGMFGCLKDALACAKTGPVWRNRAVNGYGEIAVG